MKLITKINKKISIWADENQYIVRIQRDKNPDMKHSENWYLPTLDMCFQEIFDYLCKKRLSQGKEKSLEEVRDITLKTKEEISEIMKPFTEVKP